MIGNTRAEVAQRIRRVDNAVRNARERCARWVPELADSGLWRVRVRSTAGQQVRCLSIEAGSPEQACQAALDHAQTGWRVIAIEAL
ncbi:MAG: hypothetical protein E2O66_09550 [Deltaproteobacteria bacterium]|nr:hypothetical protein [Myxococcales bacterium]TDJ11342.1 MAG: hypothetical protein E2O66_09550 [Deltaproteobacteria bacterium]TDJ20606.1 MAG: hypothetical protein E2O69_03395 [Deltaproteobacteria bacterium]